MSDDASSETSEGGGDVDQLMAMFPEAERSVVESVLASCGNNVQSAVDLLLAGAEGGGSTPTTPTITRKSSGGVTMIDDVDEDLYGSSVPTSTTVRSSSTPTSPIASRRPSYFYNNNDNDNDNDNNNNNNDNMEDEGEKEEDLDAVEAHGVSLSHPGGRVIRSKDLEHTHPFFPLIQCFAGLPPLANYALAKTAKFDWDINKNSSLCRGQFAEAFLWATRLLWQGESMPLALTGKIKSLHTLFTSTSGNLASTSTYDQQDYKDISGWILQILEDDLNRVLHAPYIEPDDSPMADQDKAAIVLRGLNMCSTGLITELFRGLQKKTIVCPDCEYISVEFEPMKQLVLSTDPHQKRVIEVTYVPAFITAESLPRKYRLHVAKSGCGADLKRALIERAGLLFNQKQLVIADVYNGRVFQALQDNTAVSSIQDRDVIVIYEIPSESQSLWHTTSSATATPDYFFLVHRTNNPSRPSPYGYSGYTYGPRLSGSPMCVSRSFTRKQIYRYVWDRFKATFGFDEDLTYEKYLAQLKAAEEAKNPKKEDAMTDAAPTAEGGEGGDVEMKGGASGEDEETRKKREQEEKDAEFARQLQAEFQRESSTSSYYSAYSGYSRDKAEQTEPVDKTAGLFILRFVSQYGSSCGLCERGWSCSGCPILYEDDSPLVFPDNGNISIDWNITEEQFPALETSQVFNHAPDKIEMEEATAQPTIFDSLNATLQSTQFPASDPWYCIKCKEMRQATQKIDLWELPEVLVLPLARLESNRWWRSLNTNHIEFPLICDFTPYLINPNPKPSGYTLVAVMNYNGTSRNYSSYIRNKDNKRWYFFDNTGCFDVDQDETLRGRLCSAEACVLFYQRVKKVRSLKEVCLLHVARRKDEYDLSLLPTELKEYVAGIDPGDVRYFI